MIRGDGRPSFRRARMSSHGAVERSLKPDWFARGRQFRCSMPCNFAEYTPLVTAESNIVVTWILIEIFLKRGTIVAGRLAPRCISSTPGCMRNGFRSFMISAKNREARWARERSRSQRFVYASEFFRPTAETHAARRGRTYEIIPRTRSAPPRRARKSSRAQTARRPDRNLATSFSLKRIKRWLLSK